MSPIGVTSTLNQQIADLTASVEELSTLVSAALPHVVGPDEVAELERLRVLRSLVQGLYDAGGTITRAKVLDALTKTTA